MHHTQEIESAPTRRNLMGLCWIQSQRRDVRLPLESRIKRNAPAGASLWGVHTEESQRLDETAAFGLGSTQHMSELCLKVYNTDTQIRLR